MECSNNITGNLLGNRGSIFADSTKYLYNGNNWKPVKKSIPKIGSKVLFTIDDNIEPNLEGDVVFIGSGMYGEDYVRENQCIIERNGKTFIGLIEELGLIDELTKNNNNGKCKVSRRDSKIRQATGKKACPIKSQEGKTKFKPAHN